MTDCPLVSVIMNCYNGEKFLREAVDSVLAQTYQNWEIIFWDNQSTDSTAEIIKSYNEPRIHYFYASEHTPLGQARNMAITKVNGAYLTFLDSDDKWDSRFLEIGLNVLNENKHCSFFYSNFYYNDRNGTLHSHYRTTPLVQKFHDICCDYKIGMSAVILDTQLIREAGMHFNKEYNLVEDYDFFLRLSLIGGFICYHKPLMFYRRHVDALSSIKSQLWADEYKLLYNRYLSELVGSNLLSKADIAPIKQKYLSTQILNYVRSNNRRELFTLFIDNPHQIIKNSKYFLFLLTPSVFYKYAYKIFSKNPYAY